MKSTVSWGILLAIAVCLMVAGFQGRLGSLMAAILTPASLTDASGSSANNGVSTSGNGGSSTTQPPGPAPASAPQTVPGNGVGTCPPGYFWSPATQNCQKFQT